MSFCLLPAVILLLVLLNVVPARAPIAAVVIVVVDEAGPALVFRRDYKPSTVLMPTARPLRHTESLVRDGVLAIGRVKVMLITRRLLMIVDDRVIQAVGDKRNYGQHIIITTSRCTNLPALLIAAN